MAKVGFVTNVQIQTSDGQITVKCTPAYSDDAPTHYVMRLMDTETRDVIERKVIDLTPDVVKDVESNGVVFNKNLTNGQTVKLSIRQKVDNQRGRMLSYVLTVGEQEFMPLRAGHYMDQIPAGEPTPEDAVGDPTRHVRLLDGEWRRYNPRTRWIASEMSIYYEWLEEAQEKLDDAEDALEEFEKNNPGVTQSFEKIYVEVAQAEVATQRAKIKTMLEEKKAAAAVRYPPERWTQNDTRWVERPKRR